MKGQRSGLRGRYLVPLALSLTFLSGCQTPSGNCKAIPVTEYDFAFVSAFAGEVASIPADAVTVRFIADSIALRDAVRACKGEGS